MGLADIVPGVSGGTVAVVLGVYGRLVHAIRTGSAALTSALRARWREASDHLGAIDWWFLVPLLVGILVALVSLAAPI